MRRAYARWLLITALAAGSAAATSCANDQETINRVQPNAIEKSMFTGEWYTLGTIVDTQVDAPVAVGFPTGFDRIQWDIQEDYLIARRTYTQVRNIEDESVTDNNETTSVVAMYAIDSHFDIRREYNPATGEQTNVVSENTVDRPWNQREYMRVDWSQNLLDEGKLPGGVSIKPVALWDQESGLSEEAKAELAPHFERGEDGTVNYFDLSNRFWAQPAMVQVDSDGDGRADSEIPACGLIASMHVDCSPGAVMIRYSFARVEDHDYQPMEYTPDRMSRFGYFLTRRDGYDDDYSTTISGRRVFTNRHNIWMQSHLKNDKGELVACTNEDVRKERGLSTGKSVCATANAASRCDMAFAHAHGTSQGACTIPYREREIRPVPYYVTPNYPENLWTTTREVAKGWNTALTTTVASLRRLECEENGNQGCSEFTPEKTPRIFDICHNPVSKDDNHAVCGPEGFAPRFGDVRYSFVSWVDEPHGAYSGAPLGLGPSFADPITGEIRSGVANLYGDGFDYSAAAASDILAMMRGDLTIEDTQTNEAFASWLDARKQQVALGEASSREADRHVIPLDIHDMAEANADMNFSWALARLPKHPQPATAEYVRQTAADQWKAIGQMHSDLAFGRTGRAKLSSLRGTPVEDRLMNDEYTLLGGLMPGQKLTHEDKAHLSPVGEGGVLGIRGQLEVQKAILHAGAEDPCLITADDFNDDGLLGLLEEIERVAAKDGTVSWYGGKYQVSKGGKIDYDLVKEMVKQPMLFFLAAHEIGHSLGLTHNFAGSYDALNYNPQYWKLRSADGTIASRASDPMTPAEINGRIREFQYSTVMDYGHNFAVSSSHGLGHYDIAAIKMGYGDLSEVFTKAPAENSLHIAKLDAQASPFMVFQSDPRSQDVQAFHYSSWPQLVGGIANIEQRKDVHYSDLTFVEDTLFGGGGQSLYPVKKDGKVVGTLPAVPYLYCFDIFSNSRPTCNAYDAGADAYETIHSIIDNYWDYYPLSHFQRNRLGWDPANVPARTMARYFDKLASHAHIYALYRQFLEPYFGAQFFEQETGFGLYTLGVRAIYDLMRKVVATPEPGQNLKGELLVDGTSIISDEPTSPLFAKGSVDSYNGRFLRSNFDIGPSFEWIYFTSSGWFIEKQLALETLLWADTGFLGTDTSPDVREYSSSFYTIFPDSMSEFMRAIYAGDVASYAPRLQADGTFTYPSPAEIVKRGGGMTGTIVSPNVGFTLQLAAMVYGMALIPNNFDQDFVNRSRIFVAGSSEAVELDPARVVSYTDDRSGLTYYAPSYVRDDMPGMEGTAVETGPGAAMINQAIALHARATSTEEGVDDLERAHWRAQLNDFVDNLDLLRFLGHNLGHGSDGNF